MARCPKSEISDVLPMALAPSEFPEQMPRIEEHLKDCEFCRRELALLKRLETAVRSNKDYLRDALVPCPSPETLCEFAIGGEDEAIEDHLKLCSACTEELKLIRELMKEDLDSATEELPPRISRLIDESVKREYPRFGEPVLQRARDFFAGIMSLFSLPSFAAGAVAAALVLLVLSPWQAKQLSLNPAGSDVEWRSGPLVHKELPLQQEAAKPPKIALVIVLPENTRLTPQQVDEIYGKLNTPAKMGNYYDFLSPKELKGILSGIGGVKQGAAVSGIIVEKTGPKYVLQFQISSAGQLFDLKGSLYSADKKREVADISQSRLPLERIPSRIDSIAMELLLEAEAS
jgi:predicted anti-sigma-YlaC factor YlaD